MSGGRVGLSRASFCSRLPSAADETQYVGVAEGVRRMRIDCHVHGDPRDWRAEPDDYVQQCRRRGVEAVLLIEPIERCLEAVEKFGDFVIPVAWVDINTVGPADLEGCIRAGAKGIKFIAPLAPYGDERYWPLYEQIEEMGVVAVFHTGYLACHGREQRPISMEHMRAAQIERISRRFPDLKVLMSHFSNPWWEEAWKVSWSCKNVYADLSGGTAFRRATRMWAEMFAPDGQLINASIEKLCFGSDVYYFRDDEFSFEPHIAFHDHLFDRIGLSPELREAVNRGNIRRLFGLA